MKRYAAPIAMFLAFEAVAVVLWLTKDNLFYLFNFTYIGLSVALGVGLFIQGNKNARRITQLLVGLYMLGYLGLISGETVVRERELAFSVKKANFRSVMLGTVVR